MTEKHSTYTLLHPPPEGRCGALKFNCANPECDYRFPEDDRTTGICPECNTERAVCGGWVVKGRTRCKFHGGHSKMGIMSPNFQTGAFSKHLPTRLVALYEEGVRNPDILNTSDDIALLQARENELLKRLQENDWGAGGLWGQLAEQWLKFTKDRVKAANGDRKARENTAIALAEIERIITKGHIYDELLWREIRQIQEQKRKLIQTEIRRRKDAADLITPDQFKTMLGFIFHSIRTHVSEQREQMAVFEDIRNMGK